MVGLALVSAMAVFGASYSESATSSVDQAISADLLISVNGSGQLSDSVPTGSLVAVSGQVPVPFARVIVHSAPPPGALTATVPVGVSPAVADTVAMRCADCSAP